MDSPGARYVELGGSAADRPPPLSGRRAGSPGGGGYGSSSDAAQLSGAPLSGGRSRASSAVVVQDGLGFAPVSSSPVSAVADPRKLGALAVAIISFGSVAGGPYGIEAAVGAAGALPTLLGCALIALMWSAPQALVTAELATAFPSNGGYITWVVRGCGPMLGFVNAANCIASAMCNLPLYPVLFASYVTALFPGVPAWGVGLIKTSGLLLALGFNLAGIQAVEAASLALTLLVHVPFVVMPIAARCLLGAPAFEWSGPASVSPDWREGFALFVATLCWNAQGWVNVGNIASDVREPQRSFPRGSGLAVLLVALNYIYPVLLCSALAPDASQWDTGFFATIGSRIAPWCGVLATVGALLSCANNFLPQMGTTSRALRFAALYRMAPLPVLSRSLGRARVPAAAILLQTAVCALLMNFSFDTLVVINVLFYNVGLMLQFAAFLALKHSAPDIPRPFAVPGGLPGAWAVALVFFSVLAVAFYAAIVSSAWSVLILVAANVAFMLGGAAWARWGYDEELLDRIDAAEGVRAPEPRAAGAGAPAKQPTGGEEAQEALAEDAEDHKGAAAR